MPQPSSAGLMVLDELLSFLFQTTCVVCHKFCGPHALCKACEEFPWIEESSATSFISDIDQCRSAIELDERCKTILHTVKYRKHPHLLRLFKQRNLFEELPTETCVVPVPMHWRKQWSRGFNQSQILAKWFEPDFKVDTLNFRKRRQSTPQVFLSKEERSRNQKEHFQWNREAPVPSSILLVDDVLTTGATLEACAKELRRAGASKIYAWTLFRTKKLAPTFFRGT